MFANKVVIFVCLTLVIVHAMPNEDTHILGGVRPVDDLKDAEKVLNTSLAALAAGEGPHYSIHKLHSATRQVVAGTMDVIDVDLDDNNGNTKRCKVSIWSRRWLPQGIEVTFECAGEEKLVKKHSA